MQYFIFHIHNICSTVVMFCHSEIWNGAKFSVFLYVSIFYNAELHEKRSFFLFLRSHNELGRLVPSWTVVVFCHSEIWNGAKFSVFLYVSIFYNAELHEKRSFFLFLRSHNELGRLVPSWWFLAFPLEIYFQSIQYPNYMCFLKFCFYQVCVPVPW